LIMDQNNDGMPTRWHRRSGDFNIRIIIIMEPHQQLNEQNDGL
jgi:hypothetical protein